MRVAVLPTGRMEWQGLPRALLRIFPGHDFYSLPSEKEIEEQKDIGFPADSFTSCDAALLRGRENNADKLVQRAAAEALGDRTREAADLVLIIDDLEIANLNQPAVVVEIMREAVDRFLSGFPFQGQARARYHRALRERVSFHLCKPMIESWLFADPQGPNRAGCPKTRQALLPQGQDPESFETPDTAYRTDTGAPCQCWHALPTQTDRQRKAKRKCRPQWLKADPKRALHPKAYLCWLCIDPTEKTCSSYAEAKGGAAALELLDWGALLGNPSQAGFARALVHDVALALRSAAPFPGHLASETAPKLSQQAALLRNV